MKRLIFVSLLILNFHPVLAAAPGEKHLRHLTAEYFAREFSVPVKYVDIEVLHFPDMQSSGGTIRYRIEAQNGQGNLGHRTLWIVAKEGINILETANYSVNVHLYMPVVVADQRIDRNSVIRPDMLRVEKRKLYRHHRGFYQHTDQLSGYSTSQVIAEGRVVGPEMIKITPDVNRGQALQVQLSRGNLAVTVEGVAREDATIGSRVRVFCPGPQREYVGTLLQGQIVKVSM